jgi:hydroxymethylpyrimidine pyrophosphatase-like HAD family hydrolase
MTMEDSIAIGDSLNDLDMLELAGFSIAMEDSPDEVIKVSDAVTKTADKGGVAAALYKYVLGM